MTNHEVEAQCNQLIQQIEQINIKLNEAKFSLETDDEIDNTELIKQRQHLLENLFSTDHSSWLQNNESKLLAIKKEVDQTTAKYQDWLETVKSQLLKNQKSKKGLKVYKNIL
ncbi:hypothetical protein KO525_02145 [Psychrosphaera sp. B3R10]|uniref:hypothetical protein n=1 Tax=unclassified Psychrosphaera TaxID=2641570 RepID=UPI001C09ADC5|nr:MULTISPECIES: hypothetical protein [unclassified Psychrosphaera]MBU2884043.1 hypothetical protein [Psychrosphaera sp. I2R16]MBU2988173.1 hypothetical protein [Psychrosphaera sp. B3R10]MDO6718382.1 hypothetical protein [Psychrosphaera sp. 1_MG-2023]